MPKNDNAHALRLIEALRTSCDEEASIAFADAYPLSKSADVDKKYRWACNVCHALEAQFSPHEAAAIRHACRCGDGKTMAQDISRCISTAGNLHDGCQLFSEQNKYAFLEYVSENEVLFGYHACVCSCIKRSEGSVPALWCECSVGYTEAMFRQVFGTSANVTLLGTAKSGSNRCAFRVQW